MSGMQKSCIIEQIYNKKSYSPKENHIPQGHYENTLKFFLKSFSPEPAGQIQSNLVQIIKFVQMKGQVPVKEEIFTKCKNGVVVI
jgi:hypothetical protein